MEYCIDCGLKLCEAHKEVGIDKQNYYIHMVRYVALSVYDEAVKNIP